MERNTILAIVLSVVVIIGFSLLNAVFFPKRSQEQQVSQPSSREQEILKNPSNEREARPNPATNQVSGIRSVGQDFVERTITLKNELVEAIFSSRGARLISFKLLNHLDQSKPIDMINLDFGGTGSFDVSLGDWNAPILDDVFSVNDYTNQSVSFSKDYLDLEGKPFRVVKNFKLFPDDYLVQVEIVLQSLNNSVPVLPGQEKGLSIILGPQIGPKFDVLDNQKEYRRYFMYANDNVEEIKINNSKDSRSIPLVWAGIAGKYFTLIGIPGTPGLTTTWSNSITDQVKNPSLIAFTSSRPMTPVSSYVVKVYMGPKQQQALEKYGSLNLVRIIDRNLLLGWLEDIMKAGLNVLYFIIPNYGVGIIILTIILRLILMPLTISSQRSMAAMASLQPKIQALQEKYKNEPGKLNEEIAKIYQKERINPLGGCLPLLLQLPLFFAFYGLLNSHFELRGAMFIPGWISDLSLPDSILSFGDFRVPIVNWNHLRLLPIIMLISQFAMSWVTPSQGTTGAQTKIFSIGLPIFFFFLLYEFPSGLVLYWTVTNILSAASQYYFNTHLKKKPAT